MKSRFLLALILIVLTACGTHHANNRVVIKEIPQWNNGVKDLFYRLDVQKSKQLKLDDIENGFDSLQIHIWYEYSLADIRKLIVLKYRNKKWSGSYYYIHADWKYQTETDSVTKFTLTPLKPRSGWGPFTKSILNRGIVTLPNLEKIIPPNISFTDGSTCNIEIATKNQYRYYRYLYYPEFAKQYWQAKNMYEILDIIKAEFGIDFEHYR
jgi:hypothetical protein